MKIKTFPHEALLWLKRLIILTGIYFYVVHAIAWILTDKSRLGLFNLGDNSYSIINDRFVEDEVKTRVNSLLDNNCKLRIKEN